MKAPERFCIMLNASVSDVIARERVHAWTGNLIAHPKDGKVPQKEFRSWSLRSLSRRTATKGTKDRDMPRDFYTYGGTRA